MSNNKIFPYKNEALDKLYCSVDALDRDISQLVEFSRRVKNVIAAIENNSLSAVEASERLDKILDDLDLEIVGLL